MINGGSLPGRLIPNMLADKLGQLNFICPLSAICAALIFAMLDLHSVAGIVIFAVVYGFISGGCESLNLSSLANRALPLMTSNT